VARWGGDELLVAVVGDAEAATAGLTRAGRIVAERLTAVLGRRATISVGVCGLRPHDSWPEAVALADAALYSAKERGRDLVVDATAPVLRLP
jgi:diguanylate cyclase (GGDEF)-like protein